MNMKLYYEFNYRINFDNKKLGQAQIFYHSYMSKYNFLLVFLRQLITSGSLKISKGNPIVFSYSLCAKDLILVFTLLAKLRDIFKKVRVLLYLE